MAVKRYRTDANNVAFYDIDTVDIDVDRYEATRTDLDGADIYFGGDRAVYEMISEAFPQVNKIATSR